MMLASRTGDKVEWNDIRKVTLSRPDHPPSSPKLPKQEV